MRAVEFYLVKYMTKDSATATLSTLVPHCPDEELAGAWCLPSHSPLPAGAPRLTPASETAAGARRGAGWRLPSPPSPLPAGAPRLHVTPVAPWDAAALLLWLREMRPLRLAFAARAAALAELWQGALRSKLSPSRGDTWRLPSPSSPPAGAPRMTPAGDVEWLDLDARCTHIRVDRTLQEVDRVAEGLAGVVGGGGPLVDVVLGVCTFF